VEEFQLDVHRGREGGGRLLELQEVALDAALDAVVA
jgi:hypothetical protein